MVTHFKAGTRQPVREERIRALAEPGTAGSGNVTARAWRNYVATKTAFPFNAKYLEQGKVTPFCTGSRLAVIGLAKEAECTGGLMARVMDGQKSVHVALEVLLPEGSPESAFAVLDWHYWVSQGNKVSGQSTPAVTE